MIRFHHEGDDLIITASERSEHRLATDELLDLIAALSSRSSYELSISREEIEERPNPIVFQERSTQPVSIVRQEDIEHYKEIRRREDDEHRERIAARQRYASVDVIDSAAVWAMRHDYTEEELQHVIADPEKSWESRQGSAHINVYGRVGAVVADDTQSILVVFPADTLADRFPYTQYQSTGRSQRFKGGKGVSYPDDIKDLIRIAQAAGLHCELKKGGHWHISNDAGEYVTTSASPSDRYALRNAVRDIHKRLGVDITR